MIYRILVIGVLISIALCAGRFAIADYYYENAKLAYEAIDVSRLEYGRELQPLIEQLDKSLKWRRNQVNALDFKANLLYQYWWLSPDAQYLDQSSLLQNAVRLHIEASSLRRNWSYSAARLTLIHSHQSRLDKRFDKWFAESHRLGLYETSIARSLMSIGLQQWRQLSDQQKSYTIDFIRISIEQKSNSPESIALILDRHNMRADVCISMIEKTLRAEKVCGDLGAL